TERVLDVGKLCHDDRIGAGTRRFGDPGLQPGSLAVGGRLHAVPAVTELKRCRRAWQAGEAYRLQRAIGRARPDDANRYAQRFDGAAHGLCRTTSGVIEL